MYKAISYMFEDDTQFWGYFEQVREPAFLLAGVLWTVNFATDVLPIPETQLFEILLISATYIGTIAISVGLVGMYPTMKEQSPRLALVGVISAGFSLVFLLVFPFALTGVAIPLGARTARLPEIGIVGGAVSVVAFAVLDSLAAVLFGYGVLRTEVLSKQVGYLLSAYAIPWIVLLSHGFLNTPFPPNWAFSLVVALFPLAIGYVLLRETRQLPRELL